MNKNAIVTSIQNKRDLAEFSFLWKTWLLWDINNAWDLLVFVHPNIEADAKTQFTGDNLMIIKQKPLEEQDDFWELADYSKANYFGMFTEDNLDLLSSYDFLFKTGCGTFLTQNFAAFTPWKDKFYTGITTHYSIAGADQLSKVRHLVRTVAKQINLPYRDFGHVSDSILGSSTAIINACKLQLTLTKYLLNNGWPQGDKGNPLGWYKERADQYALDISINSMIQTLSIHQGSLDVWCGDNKITSLDLHIRCAHSDNVECIFNKRKFHDGELPKLKYTKIPVTAGEYCFLVATEDLEYLKSLV